ncbi:12836_t:CDS:2 [Entrophospora sp. SA101]|nr:11785_t:CDS:2 [Entrophospora sp. SA101]CAJ0839105.1 12836_t:CDS:2 [Entrophospora sp. SA101]
MKQKLVDMIQTSVIALIMINDLGIGRKKFTEEEKTYRRRI